MHRLISGLAGNIALVGCLVHAGDAVAHNAAAPEVMVLTSGTTQKRATATALRPAAPVPVSLRATAPVVTVSKTGPGQAGYIHYFAITKAGGERESQIGIELADERIAWSFPEIGVVVSRLIAVGSVVVNGNTYEVEHLYGIRPFPDDESMRALQRELPARVARWVDQKTPYCEQDDAWSGRCMSCLGFVLRVLFPGRSADQLALPPDFKSTRRNAYSTEDLLLYLAGVRIDASRQARMKRIEALAVPEEMREQLIRLAVESDANPAAAPATGATPRAAVTKSRPTRSVVQLPKRVVPRKRS